MIEPGKLLLLRKALKKKKPLFVSKDSHKKVRVPARWRKPRGKHSPVRQKHRGRPRLVSVGYGSPRAVKYLHSSGLKKVPVQNKKQLEALDPKTEGLVLSRTIGNKKRIRLLELALEKKIPILNLKDPQNHLEKLRTKFKARKESQKKKLTEKEKKEMEKRKKAEEKEKKEGAEEEKKEKGEEIKTPEETKKEKEAEKKEIEKALIKKQ